MRQLYGNIFMSIVLGITLQATGNKGSDIKDPHFVAGVVEFRPDFIGLTTEQLIAKHTDAYIEILSSPEALETDIVVFPESTLNNEFKTSYVPAPEEAIIPCLLANESSRYEHFLIALSCAARDNRKYVIINFTEKEDCVANASVDVRPCAANGLNIYNTNVVFDREGRVISRYRKVNIYVERKNTTYQPEFAIFDTDFGVRFAHFICFDLLFYTPAEELVVKHGIRSIIFTSMFYSETPFLTAVQLQQSWAWGNNVTLLAAGASYPQAGATGSGIYAGSSGSLVSAMIGNKGVRQIYVAKVPKFTGKSSLHTTTSETHAAAPAQPQTGIKLLRDPQLNNFNSQLLQLNSSSVISLKLCAETLCCNLKAETTTAENSYGNGTTTDAYQYRFGVFTGRRSYEKEQYSDVAICAIYACIDDTVSSCGLLLPANTTIMPKFAFKRLKIEGSFQKTERLLIMPNTLDLSFYPLQPAQVTWNIFDKSKSYEAAIDLKVSVDNLLAFGIYANYYDSSAGAPKYDSSVLVLFSSVLLWIGTYAIDFLYI